MRKEDAWERFCCGRQGCLREGEGKDWLGCFRVRGASGSALPGDGQSLLSLRCVQGILCYSPATDVVCSGYIVVGQKHRHYQLAGAR